MKATVCLLVALAGLVASSARADGLPVLGIDVGAIGVAAPGATNRFVAVPVGNDTLVARVDRTSGRVRSSRILRGRLTIPAVAYDGSAAGLSAKGSRLVLIAPRQVFPRAKTPFAIVDTRHLRIRKRLTLRGDFSFDATSPDGRWLYLIHYTVPNDPLQYEVRALDTVTGKLLPGPIVDPREPDEAMTGRPLTRATSRDGRWAYTLYESANPFVHALDTVGRSARCIELDWLRGRKDLARMRLAVGAGSGVLGVRAGRRTVATIDTRTFVARRPAFD